MVPINAQQQVNSDANALQEMAKTEKTYATNRAQGLGVIVAGCFGFVLIILGIVLGVTGVFTPTGAVFAVLGGILGGIAVGLLTGGMFYVIKMWTSTSWGSS